MILYGVDIKYIFFRILCSIYRTVYLPFRVFILRKKKTIIVAFVVSDLGKWKTELLYKAMVQHNRFEPYVFVTPYCHYENDGIGILINYLKEKGYRYILVDKFKKFNDFIKPDIIFYQEPYKGIIDGQYEYKKNLYSLFCYVAYGFHWNAINWILNQPLLNICWQIYYENEVALKGVSDQMTNGAKNCIVTGLPISDVFLLPKSAFRDPWKVQEIRKKRIIWAPHYTINNSSAFCYSTFLSYCDYMLDIADKFHDSIQIAFKPHPVLLTKLYEIWGKEKTDSYYAKWKDGNNTQLESGEYVGLFMHSDAMIHDCGTFTVEYHYTRKPVLYLLNGEDHYKDLNEFGRMAFDLHYKGSSKEDIEAFINNVIEGKDEMKEVRDRFYHNYLLPPNNDSASDNIIKAILGE